MQPSLPGKPPERVLWPGAVCIPRPSPCQLSKAEEETISSYQISWKYRWYEHVSFRLMIPLTSIFWLCDYVSSSHLTISVRFCRHGHCAKVKAVTKSPVDLVDWKTSGWPGDTSRLPLIRRFSWKKMEAASAYCTWWAANACDIVWWHRQNQDFHLLGEKSYWHDKLMPDAARCLLQHETQADSRADWISGSAAIWGQERSMIVL